MLEVGIHEDDRVAASPVEPGRQRRLMSEVARERYEANSRVSCRQEPQHLERAVGRPVVDIDQLPGDADGKENFRDPVAENRQILALVEASDDDGDVAGLGRGHFRLV